MRIEKGIPVSNEQNDKHVNIDLLEECMLNSLCKENLEWEDLTTSEKLIEATLSLNEISEDVMSNGNNVWEVEKSSEVLILKEFPKHLWVRKNPNL